MFQESLFPIQIVREEDFTGTAHLKHLGYARNGERYALKTLEDHPLLPITEWFCYRLCHDVGIPTPGFAIVSRPDDSLALGSRIDADTVLLGSITANPMGTWAWVRMLSKPLSGIFGLDYFLPNPDRHLNNVLCRPGPGNALIALAFDWSLVPALGDTPVFSKWPWAATCNSAVVVGGMKAQGIWDHVAASRSLSAIAQIQAETVRSYLDSAPEEWRRTPGLVDAIVSWWATEAPVRARGSVP